MFFRTPFILQTGECTGIFGDVESSPDFLFDEETEFTVAVDQVAVLVAVA